MPGASQLSQFLDGSGDRPYRDLIQYHMKRQSTVQLRNAAVGEGGMLPAELQPHVEEFIDVAFDRLAREQLFWRTATCEAAFEAIIQVAIDVFPLRGRIESTQDALAPENHHLAFQLFQIPTVSFAYSASTQRGQRKFMGIRKGLFG